MKEYNTCKKLVLFFTLMCILSACQKKETHTILSGRLPYFENDSLILVEVNNYFPVAGAGDSQYQILTDSTGRFILESDQIRPGYYQILLNNYPKLEYDIYLEPGDSIYFEQPNWNQNPELKINGKGAEKLNYLVKDFELLYKNSSYKDTIRSNGFETEMLFKSYIDSITNIRTQELEANSTIPVDLKSRFANVIQADRAVTLLSHLKNRNRYLNNSFDYFYPDTSYYSFLENISFDSLFCESSKAKELAQLFLENKARIAFKDKSEEEWWEENLFWKFKYITEQEESIWTDYLALSTISGFSHGMNSNAFFENLIRFNEEVNELLHKEANRKLFDDAISDYLQLASGEPAPNFALPDAKGNIVELSDFKGKIVYLDFWGTWCYPCIQEIPSALKLQEEYKDKPVVFLYVALEYDEENIASWRQFILGKNERFSQVLNNKPFPGIHLVAEKQFLNPVIKPYKLNFAPTYVLIDQKGNIVSARAERANNISEDIDKLLEQM
ncbi:MAG: TlpA family protein disulfide reductase [Flavobacteriales bacterium]|nr:TlpA family protein disulfide reductase [Flavobacteriales bacterium]